MESEFDKIKAKTEVITSSNQEKETREPSLSLNKILGILIFLVVIIFAGIIVKGSSNRNNAVSPELRPQPISTAQFALIPSRDSYKVGDPVPVAVRLSTGGHSSIGADLYISYDPNLLSPSQTTFAPGSLYDGYPAVKVDSKKGVIQVSGISSSTGSFNGLGLFGTLTFTAKAQGDAQIVVEYAKDATSLSNVIELNNSNNLLNSRAVTSVTINKTATNTIAAPNCSQRTLQYCQDTRGHVGTYWCNSINDPYSCNAGCFKEQTGYDSGCSVSSTK